MARTKQTRRPRKQNKPVTPAGEVTTEGDGDPSCPANLPTQNMQKKHPCPECGKHLANEHGLNQHIKSVHSVAPPINKHPDMQSQRSKRKNQQNLERKLLNTDPESAMKSTVPQQDDKVGPVEPKTVHGELNQGAVSQESVEPDTVKQVSDETVGNIKARRARFFEGKREKNKRRRNRVLVGKLDSMNIDAEDGMNDEMEPDIVHPVLNQANVELNPDTVEAGAC